MPLALSQELLGAQISVDHLSPDLQREAERCEVGIIVNDSLESLERSRSVRSRIGRLMQVYLEIRHKRFGVARFQMVGKNGVVALLSVPDGAYIESTVVEAENALCALKGGRQGPHVVGPYDVNSIKVGKIRDNQIGRVARLDNNLVPGCSRGRGKERCLPLRHQESELIGVVVGSHETMLAIDAGGAGRLAASAISLKPGDRQAVWVDREELRDASDIDMRRHMGDRPHAVYVDLLVGLFVNVPISTRLRREQHGLSEWTPGER